MRRVAPGCSAVPPCALVINRSACGPLDVGDVRARIPTEEVPADEVATAMRRATASDAYDGPREIEPAAASPTAAVRSRKVQCRTHERYSTVRWFESLRVTTGLPAPALLDSGTVATRSGERWWSMIERIPAGVVQVPHPAQQRALGAALRTWHDSAPEHGLRFDDPGGLGVFLGRPMVAIHSDVSVGNNALFRDDELVALIDPGAVHVGPPMLDLAWCLAVDLALGADAEPLFEGYGRDAVDVDVVAALLPFTQVRHLVDSVMVGRTQAIGRLLDTLRRRAPDLLRVSGLPARLS